jgi:hypothetical protein
MARRNETRIPRGSIAVSIFRDPDFIVLMHKGRVGRDAVLLFFLLIVAAKDQRNDGRFKSPITAVAALINWPKITEVQKALDFLEAETNWIKRHGPDDFTIRNYKKWNESLGQWGGKRPGAGRRRGNQDDIQDENLNNQDDTTLHSSNSNRDSNREDLFSGKGAGNPKSSKSRAGNCTESQAKAIYALYPRKAKPKDAVKAIRKAADELAKSGIDDPVGYLQDRVEAFAKSPAGQPPPRGCDDFRPYPATWFNSGSFDNDEQEWQRPNGGRKESNSARASAGANPAAARDAKRARECAESDRPVPEL